MNTLRRVRKYFRWMVLLFFGSTVFFVVLYKWVPVSVTPLMLLRCGQQAWRGDTLCLRHRWVPLDSMSAHLPVAVMASEDQRFLEHRGFDFVELRRVWAERQAGTRFRGGSTISQQTAKNVFLLPQGGWARKGLEAYFTILIELLWGKERIMEVYLNSIETGPGIYGAEAVAWWHFGCPARWLGRESCALIAATLPAPLQYSSARPGKYMRRRQKAILTQMKHIKPFP